MTESTKKFSTHVCLVSKQAAANFLPAVRQGFEPSKIILVVTDEMEKEADRLEQYLKQPLENIEIEKIRLSTADDINKIENELINQLDASDKGMALNATGGTKPMMLAALNVFKMMEKPAFYLSERSNDLFILNDGGKDNSYKIQKLSTKFKLKDYLGCYGFKILSEGSVSEFGRQNSKLLKQLAAPNAESVIPFFNCCAKQAENSPTLTFKGDRDFGGNIKQFIKKFCDAGICIQRDERSIEFTSEEARFFVNGGWLEEYVFNQVKGIPGVREVKINLEIASELGSKNEIDVAFVYEEHLYIIECKTCELKDNLKHRKQEKPRVDKQAIINKLNFLGTIGGSTTGKILISRLPVSDAIQKRAEDLHIGIIQQNLTGLQQQIIRCLNDKRKI